MLIEFTVGNFRSFAEPQTLSFEATAVSEFKENLFKTEREKLLKSIVFYGANSSGKSNFLNAMNEMKDFIFSNIKKASSENIDYDPFLLREDLKTEPSFFELVFRIGGKKYRYGFEIDNKVVKKEWLFSTSKRKEDPLFVRIEDGIQIFKDFEEGLNLESKTKNNSLFLSVVDQFNGTLSKEILKWIMSFNIIDGTRHNNYRGVTFSMLENDEMREKLNKFYTDLDLGFKNINIHKEVFNENTLPNDLPEDLMKKILSDLDGETVYSLTSSHVVYDSNDQPTGQEEIFNVRHRESAGTNKVIDLSGPIFDTLKGGGVLAVDELDAKLHPFLTLSLIRLFQDEATNPNNAQLIFTTHSTTILSRGRLRRDQIYFTDKKENGASEIYSLVEYNLKGKRVRKDNSFEKDYLDRKYGAVPSIGKINQLEWLEK